MYKKNTDELYYFHLDVMGSLVAITDESGILLESRNYDPWGKPRNPQTLAYTLSNPFGGSSYSYTLRGYTFHEHYEMFDLINMNGRLYDNQIGQFINADPILADNENLQNYNRYSYVMNNPLKYTDPSGYVYTGGGGAGTYGSGTSMEEISQTSRETERFERGIQDVKESFLNEIFNFILTISGTSFQEDEKPSKQKSTQIWAQNINDVVINNKSYPIYQNKPLTNSPNIQAVDLNNFIGMGLDIGGNLASDYKKILLKNRVNSPLMNKINGQAPSFPKIQIWGRTSNWIGKTTAVLNGYSLYSDYYNPEVSAQRFSYRFSGTAIGMITSSQIGGWPGTLVGLGFTSGEMLYDLGSWYGDNLSIALTRVERGFRSGWVPYKR